MVSKSPHTGIVLPYEQAAMRGDLMPDGLPSHDQLMFQNLSLLYKRKRSGMIDREQAVMEKRYLLDAYRTHKSGSELIQSTAELRKRIETAASAYCTKPSIEAADALIKAIYKVGRKTQ